MTMWWWIIIGICFAYVFLAACLGWKTPKEERRENDKKLVCPHCQTPGFVHTKEIEVKTGISGSKATAAYLTGGASIWGTGLSKKKKKTQAKCSNCGSK